MRPLSVLAVRLPQIIGWIIDSTPLLEPLLSEVEKKKQRATDVLSNTLYKAHPVYLPPKLPKMTG